jgi:hypothetical protein
MSMRSRVSNAIGAKRTMLSERKEASTNTVATVVDRHLKLGVQIPSVILGKATQLVA